MARSCHALWNAEILAISPFKNSFPTPHHPTPFIFAIFVHHYFAAHKSVGILCVCVWTGGWGQCRTIYLLRAAQDYNSSLVQVGFPHHCVAIVSIERFSLHTGPSISSTSFPSTQHFLPFCPAIPSFLLSTSFLATKHFLPLPLGPFSNIFLKIFSLAHNYLCYPCYSIPPYL